MGDVLNDLVFKTIQFSLLLKSLSQRRSTLFLLSSCDGTRQPELPTAYLTVDNFTAGSDWVVDSANNHAKLSHNDIDADNRGLQAELFDNERTHTILRREVDWNASTLTNLRLSVHSNQQGVGLAVGLISKKGSWFIGPAKELDAGWNADVDFLLSLNY